MEIEGDWVKAKGTTLGADNGLGVASIIHKGFGNTNVILGRLLFAGLDNQNIQLISIDGGGLRNGNSERSFCRFIGEKLH